jgi:prephenate dehydrogenase
MAQLSIAILGLDRLGVSIALRLKHYMAKNGQHQFTMIGYDNREDFEKPAKKLKLFDNIERKAFNAVKDTDIVIMNLPYEDVKVAYELIAPDLRDGVVILDASVIKQPSLEWAKQYLTDEHHVIGFTPVINSEFMFEHNNSTEYANEDYFLNSSIFLTPSVTSIREAIDLAVNFSAILGGKSHFLDPAEHDSLTTMTEQIPQLLSIASYFTAMKHNAWQDAQRLTNPSFNVLTRYLFTHHPDALRDEWMGNSDNLVRAIDDLMVTLSEVRGRIAEKDEAGIEAFIIDASDDYQVWVNKRHNGKWEDTGNPDVRPDNSVASSLLGGSLSKRLFGDRGDKK